MSEATTPVHAPTTGRAAPVRPAALRQEDKS
jgi:hypothetical protein